MELQINIEELKKGNEKEFKELYQLYFPHFLSFALSYVKVEDAAHDLVQDTFIAYWEKHSDFSDEISLKVFFYRAIRNKCLNHLRDSSKKEKQDINEFQHLESTDYLEEQIIQEEVAITIRQQIAKLSPQAKKILLLSLEGKSNQEIAKALSISINTVKTHKLKAYSQLRIHLQEIYSILQLITFI